MSSVMLELSEAAMAELDKKLDRLGAVDQSAILLNGMRAAGRKVRDRSRELAPAGRGESDKARLRTISAWKVKAFLHENEPLLEVRVKASRRAPHLHLVELGHEIVVGGTVARKNGKAPKAKDQGRTGAGKRTGKTTKPTLFISRGSKASEPEQKKAMQDAAKAAIKKLIGG